MNDKLNCSLLGFMVIYTRNKLVLLVIQGDNDMKIKEGFVLRDIGGETVVVSTGEASKDFYGMIKLNQTGKIIWEGISEGLSKELIVTKLLDQYDVDKDKAENDVDRMIDKMAKAGFFVDE